MKRLTQLLLLTLILTLSACSAAAPASDLASPQPNTISTESDSSSNDSATLSDQQGAVTVEVTSLNLDSATDTLDFDVVMDTHSVDLSMDLASLATLTTDTGITVRATLWDAPLGGHHVAGKLIFPATQDGKSILEGARTLTLTLVNVDIPSRSFEWDLN